MDHGITGSQMNCNIIQERQTGRCRWQDCSMRICMIQLHPNSHISNTLLMGVKINTKYDLKSTHLSQYGVIGT